MEHGDSPSCSLPDPVSQIQTMASTNTGTGAGTIPFAGSDASLQAPTHDLCSSEMSQGDSDAAADAVSLNEDPPDPTGSTPATDSGSAQHAGPGGSEGAGAGSASERYFRGSFQIDAKSRTRVAHWNVRTLNGEGKLAALISQLRRYNVMICGVCDTKLLDSGTAEIEGHTLWYSGAKDGRHRLGVGIVVSNRMETHVNKFEPVDERIILLRLKFKVCDVTVVEALAPSETADEDLKKRFYDKLREVLETVAEDDVLLLLGDFGAQVGSDYNHWGHVLGPHGVGPEDANGRRLLEFCRDNRLVVCNTQFQQKDSRKVTWVSPDDQTGRIVDFVITRGRHSTFILNARSYKPADIGSDHNLVVAEVRVKLFGKRPKNVVKYSNVPRSKVPRAWQYNY